MTRSPLLWFTGGLLLGVLALGLLRFVLLPAPDVVHYHANWALWVQGERVDFSADRYMEDVAACTMDPSQVTGPGRVHMHENNPDVVHVHHGGATWAHLLQNLGWGIGSDWLVTDRRELIEAVGGARLTFVLNGFEVPPAQDRVIRPGDRLLISFGTESSEALVRERFETVATSAPSFDGTFDPAGCAGHEHESFGARARRAFWM